MSEQKKDSEFAGADSSSAVPDDSNPDALSTAPGNAVDTAKPGRRRASKAKAAPEPSDEKSKPKKTRASSRGSTAKNVLLEASANSEASPESRQTQSDPMQAANDNLPPLPPPPVPTPEGIAFMQQHVAFQTALDQRAEARRTMLGRSMQTSNIATPREGGQAKAKTAGATFGKAVRENSIEAGLRARKVHISEADLPAFDDTNDPQLLRLMLERSRLLKVPNRAAAVGENVAQTVESDVAVLRSIKDAVAHRIGLAIVAQNRRTDAKYMEAFDKLAPDLKLEAETSGTEKARASQLAGTLMDWPKEKEAAGLSTAVPDSVRKRFLQVDGDYYFPDRSPAFTDRGPKLATRGEHPEVIRALVEIAKERGWNSVTIKGSETFRRAAWMEAARSGLQVGGYKPTDLDLAALRQREPRNSIEFGTVLEQVSGQATSLAKRALQAKERALEVKLAAFGNGRPTLVVKQYPELVQAYALLDAARKFAEVHLPGHEDRFVEIGRELIIQQLRDGKDVIGPRVHRDRMSHSHPKPESVDSRAVEAYQWVAQVPER